jgi:tRNA-modifying protein YgfZ
MVPAASAAAYEAARHRAAFADRSMHGRIVLSGADRASYLNGLLTNDIAALTKGLGCYAAYLTPQGRMIADLWVYELGDVILVMLAAEATQTVLAKLEQFIFSEDVQLGDVTQTFGQVAVIGPDAAAAVAGIVASVSPEKLNALPLHGNMRADWNGSPVVVTRIDDTGEPGFDLYVERERLSALFAALERGSVVELDRDAADAIRIEAGVPAFPRDMDEETIPLEAGIESKAISFTKGCYVGQEVIIRVLHRGHGRVARRLVGLSVDNDGGGVPAASAIVRAGDREVGRVTSAAFSPALHQPIALAYVHRDFVEPGTGLTIDGRPATVTALPFVAAAPGAR